MSPYDAEALCASQAWARRMMRKPTLGGRLTHAVQGRINRVIPERVHRAITAAFKGMTKAVLTGSEFITRAPLQDTPLQEREEKVKARIEFYKTAAAAEGAATGAGGILLSLADFPLWLSLKLKMLFDVAALYGHETAALSERLFLLHVFQLAFSSRSHRRKIFGAVQGWDAAVGEQRPEDVDWRAFQQEYRDYIDLAKLLQLVPGIGAAVGAVVNHRLTDRLGETAVNAYRLRWFAGSE